MVREWMRDMIPPALMHSALRFAGRETVFVGPYPDWQTARRRSGGYDNPDILARVKDAMLKVKEGRAVAERDSVLLDRVDYAPAILVGLFHAALNAGGKPAIIDFGGSLGSSYYRYRTVLAGTGVLRWRIVEQSRFVACGNDLFANDELTFYRSLGEALHAGTADAILFSSSLQYAEDPYAVLSEIVSHEIPYLIFDRLFLVERVDDLLMVQRVPRAIYDASYPLWFFARRKFFEFLNERYAVVMECDSSIERPIMLQGGMRALPRGLVMKLKTKREPR